MIKSICSENPNIVGYVQTTREHIKNNGHINIAFEEEHSHATTQKLYFDKDLEYDIVVFVDDEITTGKTILNFIDKFEKHQPNKQYIVASVLNWQNSNDRQMFKEKNIYTVSLVIGKIKDNLPKFDLTSDHEYDLYVDDEHYNITLPPESNLRTPAIAEQCFNKFTNILKYKCEWNNIKFIKADRFYPSSKLCSCCGNIKRDLKLKDRTYKCSFCGLVIDRDFNASLNLANYKLA